MGTLGRKLLDGAASVKLFGEMIEVAARIESLRGLADMRTGMACLHGWTVLKRSRSMYL